MGRVFSEKSDVLMLVNTHLVGPVQRKLSGELVSGHDVLLSIAFVLCCCACSLSTVMVCYSSSMDKLATALLPHNSSSSMSDALSQGSEFGGDGYTEYQESVVSHNHHKPKVSTLPLLEVVSDFSHRLR